MTDEHDSSNRLPVLAADIKRAHAGVKAAAEVAAEHALEAGRGLIEAKALLKHGQWLPWLKEHVGFSERTAQLYMRIVELGFKSATVADLGLQAAAKAMMVITDEGYDPFYGCTDEEIRQWLLFMQFLQQKCGHTVQGASAHVEYLRQRPFSLDEWLGKEGEQWRRLYNYRNPKFSSKLLLNWKQFLKANADQTREDIEAKLKLIGDAEPLSVGKRRRRNK